MIDVYLNQIENLNQQQLILISIFQPKLLDFFYFNKKQLYKQYENMYTM